MRPRKKSNNEKSHLVVSNSVRFESKKSMVELDCEASRSTEPQSATICYNDYLDMILLQELFSYQNDHGSSIISEVMKLV